MPIELPEEGGSYIGSDGNETIWGGPGTDIISGGQGDDEISGGGGYDSINGGFGNDTIVTAYDPDVRVVVSAGGGDDSLSVASGVARGVSGNNYMSGRYSQEANVTLYGGVGNDTIVGIDRGDYADGFEGNDRIIGDLGLLSQPRVVHGGKGRDTFEATGTDLVDWSDFDLRRDIIGAGFEILEGIDVFNTSEGDDSVRLFGAESLIDGRFIFNLLGGNDTLIGSDAGDYINGGYDNDWLDGGAGDDEIIGGVLGRDTLVGGAGDDTITGDNGSGDGHGWYGGDDFQTPTQNVVVINDDLFRPNGELNVRIWHPASLSILMVASRDGIDLIRDSVHVFQFNDETVTFQELLPYIERGLGGWLSDEADVYQGATDTIENIDASGGDDWITVVGNFDTLDGGEGNDMLSFAYFPDSPDRSPGDFRLIIDMEQSEARSSGGIEKTWFSGFERVTGTIYADYIRGNPADNYLRGLGDYDWFAATEGQDTIDGGNGLDMVTFIEWEGNEAPVVDDIFNISSIDFNGVRVDLANPSNNLNLAAGQTLISIERITGSSYQDIFFGDENQNDFRGLGGFDFFVGSTGGRERYFGGDGKDTVTYFMSASGVVAALGNGPTIDGDFSGYGTAGDAALDLYFSIENLIGSRHNDRLTGTSDVNQLNGLAGDDVLLAYGGNDYLKGGVGNDTLDGGAGSDFALFNGNRADYTLTRTSSTEVTIAGIDGTDSLINVEYFQFDD